METKLHYFLNNVIEILLSIPNTILFNISVLPLKKALKLPFAVSYHVHWKNINKKNFIINNQNLKFASNRIGFGFSDGGFRESKKCLIAIKGNGKIIINGTIGFGQGIVLEAYDGDIEFGNNFRCNYSCTIHSENSFIKFGENISLGWNVTVKNYDGHNIVENNFVKPKSLPIDIGDHCWICSNSDILKGVRLGNDCVVAYKSIVTHSFDGNNLLLAGCPAKKIKENINWKE